MDETMMREMAVSVLEAWNTQDVDTVANCYTEDVSYLDPNTRGYVSGREDLKRYLGKLFAAWRMTWAFKDGFLFKGGDGCAVLWHATIRKHDGEKVLEFDGMDLVLMRDDKVARNEVYFDRTALIELLQAT